MLHHGTIKKITLLIDAINLALELLPLKCMQRVALIRAISRSNVFHLLASWSTTCHCFYPINPKARAKKAGIMNKVCLNKESYEKKKKIISYIY